MLSTLPSSGCSGCLTNVGRKMRSEKLGRGGSRLTLQIEPRPQIPQSKSHRPTAEKGWPRRLQILRNGPLTERGRTPASRAVRPSPPKSRRAGGAGILPPPPTAASYATPWWTVCWPATAFGTGPYGSGCSSPWTLSVKCLRGFLLYLGIRWGAGMIFGPCTRGPEQILRSVPLSSGLRERRVEVGDLCAFFPYIPALLR
mmetsp:Transcript_81953/g.187578  ORF Transcript_81953/g.187578 Transcript_81953/m.187578 type:complete len:200 (+) Transcript_81953:913-1512(+)